MNGAYIKEITILKNKIMELENLIAKLR